MRGDLARWERSEGLDEHIGKVMLLVLLGGFIFGGFVFWRMSMPAVPAPSVDLLGLKAEVKQAARPGSGYPAALAPQPVQAQAQPQAEPEPVTEPAAEPTAAPAETGMAHVANTDGAGVVLRSEPRDNAWTPRGYMDGAEVTVLERHGPDWARIRGANGQEGWVPARYLTQ
jgi:hypothetical protein